MRFKVEGSEIPARILTGYLIANGYTVTSSGSFYDYLVTFEYSDKDLIGIDGIECVLEAKIATHIAKLVSSGQIILRRGGGYQSENRIRIFANSTEDHLKASTLGVFLGILESVPIKTGFIRRLIQGLSL